jgi:hypothetical protein
MDTRTLTQVPPQIAELARSIREAAGDDDAAFVDTLEGCGDHIQAARAAVRFIQERTAMADALDAVIRSYQGRKDGLLGGVGKAREALAHFLSEIGEKSLALPEATVTLANARPSLTGDCDPWLLPDDLSRTIRQPDRKAIKDALQEGRVVPGYALSNGKPSLRILGGKAASE